MDRKKAVAYYRVSTSRQGQSGLGLDAQHKSVSLYAKSQRIKVVKKFTEVESGKRNNRPLLEQALTYCQKHKTILIIAKLDRLGRNVAFISALMESKVDFVAVDNPHASKIVLHIMAAFAEHESDMISRRTKEALAAAKRRGVKLGTNSKALAKINRKKNAAFIKRMRPVIKELNRNGITTVREVTAALNKSKTPTYRGNSRWHISTVHNLLMRIYD